MSTSGFFQNKNSFNSNIFNKSLFLSSNCRTNRWTTRRGIDSLAVSLREHVNNFFWSEQKKNHAWHLHFLKFFLCFFLLLLSFLVNITISCIFGSIFNYHNCMLEFSIQYFSIFVLSRFLTLLFELFLFFLESELIFFAKLVCITVFMAFRIRWYR